MVPVFSDEDNPIVLFTALEIRKSHENLKKMVRLVFLGNLHFEVNMNTLLL